MKYSKNVQLNVPLILKKEKKYKGVAIIKLQSRYF